MEFQWDPKKATRNRRKHGVSFDEAATAFDDPVAAYYPDALHSERFVMIGLSASEKLLYVVYAEVRAESIRIISARKATKHERTRYEND